MAGPTIRKTKAAPGVRPLAIREAAIGIDAVEQTYIGNPIRTIVGIASQSFPPKAVAKKFAGTSAVTMAEIIRPTASGRTTSPSSSPNPVRRIRTTTFVPCGASECLC